MPIIAHCPNGHRLKAPDALIGTVAQCPECKTKFTVASNRPTDESSDQPPNDSPANQNMAPDKPVAHRTHDSATEAGFPWRHYCKFLFFEWFVVCHAYVLLSSIGELVFEPNDVAPPQLTFLEIVLAYMLGVSVWLIWMTQLYARYWLAYGETLRAGFGNIYRLFLWQFALVCTNIWKERQGFSLNPFDAMLLGGGSFRTWIRTIGGELIIVYVSWVLVLAMFGLIDVIGPADDQSGPSSKEKLM